MTSRIGFCGLTALLNVCTELWPSGPTVMVMWAAPSGIGRNRFWKSRVMHKGNQYIVILNCQMPTAQAVRYLHTELVDIFTEWLRTRGQLYIHSLPLVNTTDAETVLEQRVTAAVNDGFQRHMMQEQQKLADCGFPVSAVGQF